LALSLSGQGTEWTVSRGVSLLGWYCILFAVVAPPAYVVYVWWLGLLQFELANFGGLLIWFAVLVFVGFGLFFFLGFEVRAIGLSKESVTIRFVGRSITVPWSYVAPRLLTTGKTGLGISYRRPGTGMSNQVRLSRPLGWALLHSPYAPKWFGPPDIMEEWGLCADTQPSSELRSDRRPT
jgi:hypothetical protein